MAPIARSLIVCLLAALSFPVIAFAASPTVAAFYYPWYGTPARDGMWIHWNQNSHSPPGDIASAYYPLSGPYSSDDPAILATQMAEIKSAGIDEIVSSWWGRGSFEDKRLPAVLAAARLDGIAVAVHIEPYPGRTPASVVNDIWYLRTLGITTFYVFQPNAFTAAQWAPAIDSVHHFQASGVPATIPAQVFVQTPLAGYAAAGHFDGVYTYDTFTYRGNELGRICTEAHAVGLLCAPSVGPGYDAVRATGDPPDQATSQRRDLRLDVACRDCRASRSRHDHVVQRVARRDADRAGRTTGAPRRVSLSRLRGRVGPPRSPGRDGVPRPDGVLVEDLQGGRTGALAHGTWVPRLFCGVATRTVSAPLASLPNALTVARLAVIPVYVVLILAAHQGRSLPAAILFGAAGVTDQIDGFLARRWHVESAFGKLADPLADRLLIAAAVVLLWHAGRLPWIALAIPPATCS